MCSVFVWYVFFHESVQKHACAFLISLPFALYSLPIPSHLHRQTEHGTTTGGIMNLVSSDAEDLRLFAPFVHYLWIAPLQLAAVIYLVWQEIGVSALAGLGMVLLFLPVFAQCGHIYGAANQRRAQHQDQRLQSLGDILVWIRVIKMYAWEKVSSVFWLI
jgi:ATP-binding cassette, subfamily C (CFTR/MRP), member 4